MELIRVFAFALVITSTIAVMYEFRRIRELEDKMFDMRALKEVGMWRLAFTVLILGLILLIYY